MPSLPIQVIHGQRHARKRTLATNSHPHGRNVEPLHRLAERWIIYGRRYKIAMMGIVGAAICVYCPPTPFASARARHAQYSEAFCSNLTSSKKTCQYSRNACGKQPQSIEKDMKDVAWSMEKIKFKLDASQYDDRNP